MGFARAETPCPANKTNAHNEVKETLKAEQKTYTHTHTHMHARTHIHTCSRSYAGCVASKLEPECPVDAAAAAAEHLLQRSAPHKLRHLRGTRVCSREQAGAMDGVRGHPCVLLFQ